jgi:hypothetical protein
MEMPMKDKNLLLVTNICKCFTTLGPGEGKWILVAKTIAYYKRAVIIDEKGLYYWIQKKWSGGDK